MKWIILILVACLPWTSWADEHIIVSGGPALNYFERHKVNRHDRYWGNFIDSAAVQINNIKPTLPQGDVITWFVHRTGYISRGREEGGDYIANVEERARTLGVKLMWFETRDELIQHMNRDRNKGNQIARFEYFGHSNKRCFMFDYSNDLDGAAMEPATLHIKHLSQLKRGIFSNQPVIVSWGCHSGEQYSSAWYRATGKRMKGAIGKTSYTRPHSLPFISTEGGRWVE